MVDNINTCFQPVKEHGVILQFLTTELPQDRTNLVRPAPRFAYRPLHNGENCVREHPRTLAAINRKPFEIGKDPNSRAFILTLPDGGVPSSRYRLEMKKTPFQDEETYKDYFLKDKFREELVSYKITNNDVEQHHRYTHSDTNELALCRSSNPITSTESTDNSLSAQWTPHSSSCYEDSGFSPPALQHNPIVKVEHQSENIPLDVMLPMF